MITDLSHDINGGEIPRQLLSTLSALILDGIITLSQYNKYWELFSNELGLRRFINMSSEVKLNQMFLENNQNNYKNYFKF